MAKQHFDELIQRLRVVLVCSKDDQRSDAILLERYITDHDQDAFTALVARHSHAVWSVCLGLLRDSHDSEDVFQATFLQLARKADSVRRGGDAIRGWLCRVASRIALNLRRSKTRQAKLKQQLSQDAPSEAAEFEPDRSKVWDLVVEELTKMPSRYREPLEHSLLRGQSSREAAAELGCSHVAVQQRLERGQQILRERLQRRGVVLTAGSTALAAFAVDHPLSAMPSLDLLTRTAETAIAYGTGQAVAGKAAILAGGWGACFASKWKLLVLSAVLAVSALGGLGYAMLPRTEPVPTASVAALPAPNPAEKRGEGDLRSIPDEDDGNTLVTGRVLDADGKTVANASVVVFGKRPFRPGELGDRDQVLARTQADSEGKFSLPVHRSSPAWSMQDRSIQVWAAAPGHAPITLALSSKPSAPPVDIGLLRPDVIRGWVRDNDGKPVAGAPVSVYQVGEVRLEPIQGSQAVDAPPFWPEPVTTREDGAFEFRGLNLKQGVRLRISDDRYALHKIVLDDDRWAVKSGVICLDAPRYLEGRVIAADTQKPFSGPRLSVLPSSADGRHLAAQDVWGDDHGVFRVRLLPSDNYRIEVFAPDGAPYMAILKQITWPECETRQTLDIELPRGFLIHGKIADEETGRPIPRVHAQFLPDRSKAAELPAKVLTGNSSLTTSGTDGEFTLVVPNISGHLLFHESSGNYIIESVVLNGDAAFPRRRIFGNRILPFKPTTATAQHEIKVVLRRGVPIVGQVVDPNGKPVSEGVWLCQSRTSPQDVSHGQPQPFWDGRFVLRGCAPGRTYPVLFLDAKNNFGARADLRAEADGKPIQVKLQRCGELAARYLDEMGRPVSGYSPILYVMAPPERPSDEREKASAALVAEAHKYSAFEPFHRRDVMPHTDDLGQIRLSGLIPGVRYRIDNSHDLDGNPVDFEAQAGESVELKVVLRQR